jgi:hypothetical protein
MCCGKDEPRRFYYREMCGICHGAIQVGAIARDRGMVFHRLCLEHYEPEVETGESNGDRAEATGGTAHAGSTETFFREGSDSERAIAK